jgi:HSP20 family molecular chaperone IbpA
MPKAKPALVPTAVPKAPQFIDKSQVEALENAIRNHVARRAYQLFELTGCQDGNDLSHWLQAESEVLRPAVQVHESGSWIAIDVCVPQIATHNVQIYVEPNRVMVRARRTESSTSDSALPAEEELFLVAHLEQEVDPATASASLRDHTLTVTAKRSFPETITSRFKTAATH